MRIVRILIYIMRHVIIWRRPVPDPPAICELLSLHMAAV